MGVHQVDGVFDPVERCLVPPAIETPNVPHQNVLEQRENFHLIKLWDGDYVEHFDKQDIEGLLVKNASSLNFQFRTAAQKFNIIDDRRQVSIVVWYDGEKMNSKELIKTLRFAGPSLELMRQFQRFTVSIPERLFFEVKDSFEDVKGIWCQCADTLYDDVLGFVGYEGDFPVCV